MTCNGNGEMRLSPSDLGAWRNVIEAGGLPGVKIEDIAAAFQDLRGKDKTVDAALVRYLSDAITRMLRRRVGWNHPNQGEDIIHCASELIWRGLLRPKSADGKGLRLAFSARVTFRLKDALKEQAELHMVPTVTESADASDRVDDSASQALAAQVSEYDDEAEELSPSNKTPDPDLMHEVTALIQAIDVDRFLERHVPNLKQRLAFRFHMDGVPIESKRGHSIAGALGVSDKTAQKWINDVTKILKSKVGELK